jgi:hypothetical protein
MTKKVKRWSILGKKPERNSGQIEKILLRNRGIKTEKQIKHWRKRIRSKKGHY